jgi:hypothetical protein
LISHVVAAANTDGHSVFVDQAGVVADTGPLHPKGGGELLVDVVAPEEREAEIVLGVHGRTAFEVQIGAELVQNAESELKAIVAVLGLGRRPTGE